MKKKGKKSKHNDDSFNEHSDVDNVDSTGKPSRASKTRLRRRREGSYIRSDSDSSDHDRKQKKRRKRRKRSRTTTGTTQESSDWDDGAHHRKESRVTTEDEKWKEKPKELTEKNLVDKIQQMVPYLPPDSPLWTKWTLAPIYRFLRNPNALIVIAFTLNIKEYINSSISTIVKRLMKLYGLAGSTPSEIRQILVTFNQPIPGYTGEFFYFIKSSPVKINSENFEDAITFGNTGDGHMVHSLCSHLVHLWSYILIEEECLPKGIMEEVLTDLNSLSCASQSTAHLLDKQEVLLYVPQEAIFLEKSDDQLSRDKEFCTRLEETVIYWLTKLKQVLITEELDDMEGWPGPLDEIRFWKSRTSNLSGVLTQIKSPQVIKLLRILASSHSPYLAQLRSIMQELVAAHKESASNYHYLQALSQPCGTFPNIKLSEVKTHSQKFLWVVLIIKRNAPFYNTPKRLNGLLRKFSNVMIVMCRKRIKLDSLLQGRLIKQSEKTLKNCLNCLSWWKEVYASTKQMCLEKEEWTFDYDQIFVHVDAMISRLNDLQEICVIQRLYGRKLDDTGDTSPLPLYPGVRGPYISSLMEQIVLTINSKMKDLRKISDLILDVKNTEWISHMKDFQAEVLSAEMSIQNVLEEVFDQMANFRQRLELLQLFHMFYSRDIIIRQIDKLAIQLYENFEDEVLKLRKLFEQKLVPLPKTYTHMAGRGAWAIYMKKRIESHLDMLKKADDWLPKSIYGDSVKSEAKTLSEAMAAFSLQTYEEWSNSKEILDGKDFKEKLDIPLLVRAGRDKKDIVEINFDRNLFRILAEAEIWGRVGRPVPFVLLLGIYTQREKLHNMRENISLVAKSYNDIISRLSRDERLLFGERLLPLEKKLYPCVTTYTWSSSLVADHVFVEEFQQMATEVMDNIEAYRDTNSMVAGIIQKISRRLIVKITPNKIYEPDQFRSIQTELIMRQLQRVVRGYQNIAQFLRELFTVFHGDGPEVKVQWGKYVKLVDDCVEEALSLSLRNSLKILENSVCSSSKPLFVLKMKLEDNAISFHPNLEDLAGMIFGVKRNIALALEHLSKLSRYTGSPSELTKTERSFTNALLNDPESLEIQGRIKFSIEKCFSELNLYSERWTPYRDIWEVDMSTFMETYGEGCPTISACEKDMAKYLEVADVVHGSDDYVNIRFVRLDCTHMKKGISEVSMGWFQLIAGTLYNKAKGLLEDLYKYMDGNRRKFSEEPKTLDFQLDLFRLLDNVKGESRQKASLFPVIHEQFEILNKFNFEVESEVNDQFCRFEREWKSYQKFLKETDKKLDKSYDKLKHAFLECTEILKGKVNELLKSFEKTGPFSRETFVLSQEDPGKEDYWEEAFTSLENFRNDVIALKEGDLKLISSLKFFNIEKAVDPVLINLESEINSLAMVWGEVRQWELRWIGWKSIQIGRLNLGEIDQTAAHYLSKFQKLEKDFEAKSWPLISETGEFIKSVQACLRTVNYLKNKSLMGRHWDRIKSLVGDSKLFPQGVSRPEEFSFGIVVALRLDRYVEQLSQISLYSGKEKVIENTLKNIHDFWAQETLILEQRKGLVPFQIRCRSHLQDELIDHIVSISAMKGSPFIWPFQEKVDYWGDLLPLVNQVVEDLLATQKEWLFLEKVFSNEDVKKEMARQTKQFKTVSHLWATIVLVMTKERNVTRVVEKNENLSEMLEDIQAQMERLRKELQISLQNKRQEFPRLYFIQDHELLECLANSRDPQEILPIIQKIFGNLSQLKVSFEKATKLVEIQGVVSGTGENLDFPQGVSTAGPLTSWLADLEGSIKSSVKWDMEQCLESIQQSPGHQDKWLMEMGWLSQSYLTAVHIQWTMEAMKSIYNNAASAKEASIEGHTETDFTLKKISKKLKRNISRLSETLEDWSSASSKKLGDGVLITALQRLKVEEMLIKYIHLRDVTDMLQSRNCSDLNSFEWLQHIRFNLEDGWSSSKNEIEYGVVAMKQGFASIGYGYEFTGWGKRFVVTPLVDRSFLALTTAISFHYGALLQGGPGVGKKETINQLGNMLGRHMLNLNLSSFTESSCLSNVVLGIVPTGSWAILNNIDQLKPHLVPVLSSKLALITKVKSENLQSLMLDGVEVTMDRNCGIFVVMGGRRNAGKACLSSLRAVTRPVAMIKPDVRNILEVHLHIAGFENFAALGRKLEELFSNAKDIICYQNCCEFSLASMVAVVGQAREYKDTYKKRLNDSEAIVKALQNIIMSALAQEEQVVFGSLIKDQFPSEFPIKLENQRMEEAIRISIKELGFQSSEKVVKQCMRLHEILQIYQVTIITGKTGNGKSVLRKVLKNALQLCQYQRVNEFVINPATLEPQDLLGHTNRQSGKWKEGIFTKILESQRNNAHVQKHTSQKVGSTEGINLSEGKTSVWIVLDGPVEDNMEWMIQQMLKLSKHKNLTLKSKISIIIETDELTSASPSLISQVGVVFVAEDPKSWKLQLRSWLNDLPKFKPEFSKHVPPLMEKCLGFSAESCSSHLGSSPPPPHAIISMFTNLMESFSMKLEAVEKELVGDEDSLSLLLRQVTGFCIVWSVFGTLTDESKPKASAFLKDLDSSIFPTKGTVFDYFFEFTNQKWLPWTCLMNEEWRKLHSPSSTYPFDSDYSRAIGNTETTVRSEYFLTRFGERHPVLVIGYANAGKTDIITSALNSSKFQRETNRWLHIQMTRRMRGKCVQSLIGSRLERVSSLVLSPVRGNRLTVFIDDLHAYSSSSSLAPLSQPTHPTTSTNSSSYCEFLRTLIEYRMWYDQETMVASAISNVSIVATSTLSKARNSGLIPARLQSKFAILYIPPPDEFQVRRIFTAKLESKLKDFVPSVKLLADDITVATLDTYKKISTQLLPIPSRPLHTFSIHDISRVYDGLLRSDKGTQDTKHGFVRLWFHECSRVFQDRLMDSSSRQKCRDILTEQLFIHFELQVSSLFPQTGGAPTLFGSFMGGSRSKLYEEVKDEEAVRSLLMKAAKTVQHNGGKCLSTQRNKGGNLVLFKSAVVQTTRIARVMSMSKGHFIICAESGQGRQTLTRLAAALLDFKMFDLSTTFDSSINTTENPPPSLLKNLLRDAYRTCALKNLGCCVLLTDEHVSEDTLELISIVTSTVEIADMYTKKELQEMMGQLETDHEKQEVNDKLKLLGTADFLEIMKDRVERNLHVVLCLNPRNKRFRKTIMQAPSLLKQMSVNWFEVWRRESFLEVARNVLPPLASTGKHIDSDYPIATSSIFYTFHSIAEQLGKRAVETKLIQFSSITPMHFLHFLDLYLSTTNELTSRTEEGLDVLRNAIKEINGVQAKIENLTKEALNAEKKAQASRDECEKLHSIVEKQATDANEQEALVNGDSGQLNAEVKEFEELAEVIRKEWTASLQGFEESASSLQDLSDEDITHIRSYYSAPPHVLRVLDAVMIMLDREQTWPEAKIQLGHPDFIRKIIDFDKASVTMDKLNKLRVYIQNPEFTPDAVAKYSNGARILCGWIHAIDNYCRTYLTRILPKRERLEEAEQSIAEGRYSLELNMQKLQLLKENLAELQSNYQAKLQLKEGYEQDSTHWNEILQRAQSVLELLKDDQLQWEVEVGQLEKTLKDIPIDSLFSSACLAYLGPFDGEFRRILKTKCVEELNRRKMSSWSHSTRLHGISKTNESISGRRTLHLGFEEFTKKDDDLAECMLMLEKSYRKLLIVDPFDLTGDYENLPGNLIPTYGNITLSKLVATFSSALENHEDMDEMIESNNRNSKANIRIMKPILLTKDPNPQFGTEITSQFYIINFTLSSNELKEYLASRLAEVIIPEEELRRQLLRERVVKEEENISNLKERVPRLVQSYKEAMLDNGDFPEALIQLKSDLLEANSKHAGILAEMQNLELKREQFLLIAERIQCIYSALCDITRVFPEYEISPQFFVTLIVKILDTFQRGPSPSEGAGATQIKRLGEVMEFLEGNGCRILLRQITQSMTLRDRHLFSLLLCMTYLRNDIGSPTYRPSLEELTFLSKVGKSISDYNEISGNCKDVEETDEELKFLTTDKLTKLKNLEKLANYEDLLKMIKEDGTTWDVWLKYFEPENKFPESSKLQTFQKLLVLSILRPDRLPPQIKIFAEEVLGGSEYNFLDSKNPIDLKEVYNDFIPSSPITPFVFLLDEKSLYRVDPVASIQSLSRSLKPPKKLYSLSPSLDNMDLAWKLLEEGVRQGYWVYFSNCELAMVWTSNMGGRLDQLKKSERVHNDFLLWMSINRNAEGLPMEVLRNSIKIAVESPHNFQTSMSRPLMKMSGAMTMSYFANEKAANAFNRLFYGLSYLHCNLTGRSKFVSGVLPTDELSIQDIDLEISSAILKIFVSTYTLEEMPWWAIKLVLRLQYSNHFLGECAQQNDRLLQTLLQRVICKEIVSEVDFRLSSSSSHQHPLLRMPPTGGGDLTTYHKFIIDVTTLPSNYPRNGDDNPEIYGLDPSVGILMNACQAWNLLHSLGRVLTRMVNKLVVRYQSQHQLQLQDDDHQAGERHQANDHSYSQSQLHESSQGHQDSDENEQGLGWLNDDKIQQRIFRLLETLPKPMDMFPELLKWKSLLLGETFNKNGDNGDEGNKGDSEYSSTMQYVMMMELKYSIDLLARERGRLENLLGVVQGALPISLEMAIPVVKRKLPRPDIFAQLFLQSLTINWKRRLNCLSSSGPPEKVWLGGFLHSKAYLASTLLRIAKTRGIPSSGLRWEMKFPEKSKTEGDDKLGGTADDKHIDGIVLEDLYLIGAGWDSEKNHLKECDPLEISMKIPVMELLPQEVGGISGADKRIHSIPCYHIQTFSTPISPQISNVLSVGLNSGKEDPEHWILGKVFLMTESFLRGNEY